VVDGQVRRIDELYPDHFATISGGVERAD
jgi:hypothetical protein